MSTKKAFFWKNFIKALDAEPREDIKTLVGASRLSHPLVSLGVDEKRRRVIIISGESDPRAAAMAHADIQASLPSAKVLMARPVPLNLSAAARILTDVIGRASIGTRELRSITELSQLSEKSRQKKKFVKLLRQITDQMSALVIRPYQFAELNVVAAWKEAIQQLSLVEIGNFDHIKDIANANSEQQEDNSFLDLSKLIVVDPIEIDRKIGICSIPLYDFSQDEVELFHSGSDLNDIKDILKSKDILQYFFPAPDHLALGLVENNNVRVEALVENLAKVPTEGHPFGEAEVIKQNSNMMEIVQSLQDAGLLVEGEAGIEVTENGKSLRASVRFRPREGLLSKLSKIFSVSLKADFSLKDVLK